MRDAQRYDRDPDPRSRSRAHGRPKFDHFQGLSPPPFIMGAGK